jgi:hypothetical protein
MTIFTKKFAKFAAVAVVAGSIGLGAGIAVASQPNMDAALGALQSAQNSLNVVTEDKGGHASKARHLVAEAIVQVQEGIAFGAANGE